MPTTVATGRSPPTAMRIPLCLRRGDVRVRARDVGGHTRSSEIVPTEAPAGAPADLIPRG